MKKNRISEVKQIQLESLRHISRRPALPSPKIFSDKRRNKKALQKSLKIALQDAEY